MEYPQITSLIPEGEHFDATAVNEGVWISATHLAAVEQNLSDSATTLANVNEQLENQALQAQQATEQLIAANNTITERDARITQLEAEVATLKAGPAKNPEATGKPADNLGANGLVSTDPINAEAAKLRALRDGK